MKALLIDAYRHEDKIIVWLKTPDENIRLVRKFSTHIYTECSKLAQSVLNVPYKITTKKTYLGETKRVYEIKIDQISKYESFVRSIERKAGHRLTLYNADISPEQMFLYKNKLKPFTPVMITDNKIIPLDEDVAIPLKTVELTINNNSIAIDDTLLVGKDIKEFTKIFASKDPDVILIENAFSKLPHLADRLNYYKIYCPFHRWDAKEIKYKGGKTFSSYGRTIYRDYAIRLNGRFLVDTTTMVGNGHIEGIVELCQLSGQRFQQVASRSFGAVFQAALVKELINKNYLVPFKEKPVDKPISMFNLLKFDRIGHTFDSITGFHKDVAEIDFSSLFPWIIYNYNVSAETILKGGPPYQDIPGLPIKISLRNKGMVPRAIKPLLDRRMHYKKNPTAINKAKIQGLKWVLVCSYGYLRFREFKLGIATSHMAIGYFAREIMIKAKDICEQHGYKIVHGIIDSLYIQKKGINKEDVKNICREIQLETGIPVSFEGIFKWIVFLPSVNDINRPLPACYYGVFNNGDIKARGIEVRQSSCPKIIKHYQQQVLETISKCNTQGEIIAIIPYLCKLLRKKLFLLPSLNSDFLSSSIRVSKTDYKNNIPQKTSVNLLKKKGISVLPGQKVSYVFSERGVILPEDYLGKPDIEHYKRLLIRALFVIIQPFGFTKKDIIIDERQTTIHEYCKTHLCTHAQTLQIPQRTS